MDEQAKLKRSAALAGTMAQQIASFPGPKTALLLETEIDGIMSRVYRCVECERQDECEKLLAAGGLDAAPGFCRNKMEIDGLNG